MMPDELPAARPDQPPAARPDQPPADNGTRAEQPPIAEMSAADWAALTLEVRTAVAALAAQVRRHQEQITVLETRLQQQTNAQRPGTGLFFAPLWQRLKAQAAAVHQWLKPSLAPQTFRFILVYLVLACIWLWVKDGITVDVRVQRENDAIKVFFDGTLAAEAQDATGETRIISVTPKYQDLESPYFHKTSFALQDKLTLPGTGRATVDIPVRNPYNMTFVFLGEATSYNLNISPYRHLAALWGDPEDVLVEEQNGRPQISILHGIQWMLWVVFKPFVPLSGIFFLLLLGQQWWEQASVTARARHIWGFVWMPGLVCCVSVGWSLLLMHLFTEFVPHVPDAISYLLLGKLLANGQFVLPYAQLPTFIAPELIPDYFIHWYIHKETYMLVPYLVGHPLVLAIGEVFGAVYLVPPMVGAAVLGVVFFLTYRLTQSVAFGLTAMLLCLASPFFQTQTIDYMSHNTAALYLLLAITPMFCSSQRLYVLTGLFLGMLLNTRPLTAVAIGAAIGLYFLFSLLAVLANRGRGGGETRPHVGGLQTRPYFAGASGNGAAPVSFRAVLRPLFVQIGYSILGFVPPLALFAYYNWATTGNPLTAPYIYHGILDNVGFGENFALGYGLLQGFANIAVFSLFFLKDYYISFFPFLLSFLLLPFYRNHLRTILLMQMTIVLSIGIWCFYDGNFFMYGPRFIYEAVPVFTVLYGTAFCYLWRAVPRWSYHVIIGAVFVVYGANVVLAQLQWVDLRPPDYAGIVFVPSTVNELEGFNYSDGRFYRLYQRYEGQQQVFLMRYDYARWWEWGQGMWLNDIPLTEARPLFLAEPQDKPHDIPNAIIIEWDNVR